MIGTIRQRSGVWDKSCSAVMYNDRALSRDIDWMASNDRTTVGQCISTNLTFFTFYQGWLVPFPLKIPSLKIT